jgi:hypothetical protein
LLATGGLRLLLALPRLHERVTHATGSAT